ncbi:D-alanyl-D-alanine carboxypeptidase [Streptomyces sp. WMMB 714]|uniref:D-alanyl-D-alanine carboxypeptidase n=1 Tax=Streptomyces sp. WMMB 714 TaxID=1286822 RepID=UPI0006989A03|nr:D-alanyl-D-alanine carboxypeptidase [Streptomyces sp. WMMB 714]
MGPGSAGEGPERASTGVAGAVEGVDNPTAMFRTVDADLVRSEEEDSEAAARRAERMTSAFFGPGRSAGKQGSGDADVAGEPSSAPATADGAVTGGEATDAEQPESASPGGQESGAEETGGEETGAEGSGAESPGGAAPGEDASDVREREDAEEPAAPAPEPSGGTRDAEPAASAEPAAPRVDEPTAVFRTPSAQEPAGAAARGDQPTAVFRTVEPGETDEAPAAGKTEERKPEAEKSGSEKSGTEKSGEDEPGTGDSGAGLPGDAKTETLPEPRDKDATTQLVRPVDPRLAVAADGGTGRLPAQKKEPESGAGKKAEPETGADGGSKGTPAGELAEAAGKTPEKAPEKAPAKSSEEETDSERTSQFVPLRSADAPPRPTRKPDGPAAPPKPLGRPAAPAAGELPAEAPAAGLSEAERTRQEVRPDQAPLDLLAQLTNTPPPPETPLRTAVRRVKIWTPLVLLLIVLFAVAQAVRPLPEAKLALTASPTHTFQGPKPSVPWPSEGQARLDVQGLGSFGSSGKQKPVPIASVAKVMTAYVILREHPVKKGTDGASIPVDKKAEEEAGLSAQNESTVEVEEGDKISQREAVQALMIASANNVARLLARWDAGSEKAFAKKMNAAADDLGMKNTHYTDPSGLTASTVSTAEDQVKLAKKAMGIDLFREIVRLPGYRDAKGEEHGNWNKLVPVDGVVGIKTGTTTKAGGNLLFAAEEEIGGTKQLIVGAVLGQYRPSILDTVLQESKRLIDTAQDALRAQKVVRKGDVVGYVDDQLGGRTPVVATRDVTAVGWSGLKVKLAMSDGGKPLPHEGSRGDRAGTLTVGDGPGQVRVPLALKEDMAEPGFGAKLTRIL